MYFYRFVYGSLQNRLKVERLKTTGQIFQSSCSSNHRSASMAAIQPEPAAVIAWR